MRELLDLQGRNARCARAGHADRCVVDQQIDRLTLQFAGHCCNAVGAGDIELDDVNVLTNLLQLPRRVRIARGRDHVPAGGVIFPCELESDSAIRAGDQHGAPSIISLCRHIRSRLCG
jgi:hypothetical protein